MYLAILLGAIIGTVIGSYLFTKEHGFKWSMVIGNAAAIFFLICGYLWLVKSESSFRGLSLNIATVLGLLTIGAYYLDDQILKKKGGGGVASPSADKTGVPRKTGGRAKRGGNRGLW